MGRDNKKRKKDRKQRVKEQREADAAKVYDPNNVIPRSGTFNAKARRGDKAEFNFTFSGVPVPVDDPNEDLRPKHERHKGLFEPGADQIDA